MRNHAKRLIERLLALPLKIKAALFSSLVFVLGIGGLTLYVVDALRQDFETLIGHEQATAAGFLARTLDAELQLRLDALALMSRRIEALPDKSPRALQAYLLDQQVAGKVFTRDLYVLWHDGVRIAESPERGSIGTQYRDSAYFVHLMATRKPVVRAWFGRFAKKPVLLVAVPIFGPDGSVLGALCGTEVIAPGSHFHLTQEVRNGQTGGFHVYARDQGIYAASTDPSRVLQEFPAPGINPLFDRRLKGYLGPGRVVDSKGVEIISAAAVVRPSNWMVVAYLPTAEAFAPLRSAMQRIYGGATLITILAGWLMWLGLRHALAPLERAARKIGESGAGAETLAPLTVEGSGEIRLLLQNFNLLQTHVAEQNEVICRERDQLESIVAERTREVTASNAELRLRAAEVEDLYEHAPCGYHSVDHNAVFRRMNATELEWLGYTREELVGRMRLPQILVLENGETFEAYFDRFRRGGRVIDMECDLIRKDGSALAVLLSSKAIVDANGNFVSSRTTVFDNRKRKELQTALRKSEAMLHGVLDNTPAMIAYWNHALINEFANYAFEALYGLRPADVNGRHLRDVIGAEAFAFSQPYIDGVLRGEAQYFERQMVDRHGRHGWSQVHYIPDRDGEVIRGYFALVSDITPLKEKEVQIEALNLELGRRAEEAEAATRAKSVFLANMSHEIRTPMNAILGLTHALRRTFISPLQADMLGKLAGAAAHLLGVINDILDISKIEANKLVLEKMDFSLDEILARIQSMLGEQVREKGLEFVIDSPAGMGRVNGDAVRLSQALLNYAGNAVKFTERGKIILRVRVVEECKDDLLLRFEVQDTGIGIPAAALPRLFKAFEQADDSSTRRYGGTGLGLAITRRLAELMGGEAGVISTPQSGSTFWLTARLGRAETTTSALQSGLVALAAGGVSAEEILRRDHRDARILLVEDEPLNQEVARFLLGECGLHATVAGNGAEAVALLASEAFDLVLMDMQMPVMDGLEATRRIRQMPACKDLPILAMTANAFAEDRAACLKAGMDDFVSKPVDPEAMYEVLLKNLRSGRAVR